MKKTNLFQGLAACLGSLAMVATFMTSLAWERAGDINRVLGINKTEVAKDGVYKSEYENKEAFLEAESAYTIQCEEEGSVLLKNKDHALPLKAAEGLNVTLFGNASVNNNYHGGSGGPSNTGTSLINALKGEGFNVNQKVYDAIAAKKVVRGNSNIGEVPASTYNASDFDGYKDAAIITLCRTGGEQNDMDVKDSFGVPELSLHDIERETLELVKNSGFKKIIVLLNTGYPMELDWLDEYNVDSCLWIGFPGESGMIGVAKMLKGEASPTGRLVDTYAANSLSSAAMQNFGDFKFSDLPNSMYHNEYVVYAEGIYVGYKYYETRYMDQVLNRRNANGNYGVYASKGSSWNYDDEMNYTFGYGLTYTDFKETLKSLEWDRTNNKVVATVEVENIGTSYTTPVKDTVELYASLPWEVGMAEKSAIQLIGFAKTEPIAPGAKVEVTIEADDYYFATYDEKATNGADSSKKGCYTFDAGDYYFAIGDDAHDALNNVLAKQSVTGLTDGNGNTVAGDAAKVEKVNLAALDNTTHAKSNGVVVSNQFPEVDLNNYEENEITYMTRGDWSTFPKTYTNLEAKKDASGFIEKHMTARSDLYEMPSDAPDYKTFKFRKGDEEASIKFYELHDLEWDDPKWETFIDQLSLGELYNIPGEKMANDAIPAVGYPKNSAGDGPDGLQSGGKLHVAETLACSTFNVELLEERGKFLAEDGIWNGINTVYGGGCNLHRTPYGGRNFEYYSEDANLSSIMGRHQASSMTKHGMIGTFKHFCGNDQETNRHGVASFMTEQTLRQGDLRGFEGALRDGGALGNMSAYNRLGVMPTASYKALMTNVLRDEWGFKGISMTDSSKDATTYIFTGDAMDAGTDQFNNDAGRCQEVKDYLVSKRDGNIWMHARQTAKRFFYAYSRSFLVNGLGSDTVVDNTYPWWKATVLGFDSLLGLATVGSIAAYAVFKFVKKEAE